MCVEQWPSDIKFIWFFVHHKTKCSTKWHRIVCSPSFFLSLFCCHSEDLTWNHFGNFTHFVSTKLWESVLLNQRLLLNVEQYIATDVCVYQTTQHNLCAQCVSSDFMLLSQVSRSLKVFVCFRVLALSSSFWWCCAVFIISFDVTFSESFMFDLFLFYLSSENHPKYLFELFLLMVWTVWQWFPNGLSKHINTLAYI